jgi:hypothetical protein
MSVSAPIGKVRTLATYRTPISPLLSSAEPRPQIHSPVHMSTVAYLCQQSTYHHTDQTMVGKSTDQSFLGLQGRYLKAVFKQLHTHQRMVPP